MKLVLYWILGLASPRAAPLAAEGTGEQEDTEHPFVVVGRCRGPCFRSSAPKLLQGLQQE